MDRAHDFMYAFTPATPNWVASIEATQIHLAVSTPNATGRDWRPRALQGSGGVMVRGITGMVRGPGVAAVQDSKKVAVMLIHEEKGRSLPWDADMVHAKASPYSPGCSPTPVALNAFEVVHNGDA